ncbi:hypothetical protein [Phenylobacterium sp.]|uniref:hypothetical protein n=1 Tax=Phenylobacterium sp. TaxID=1871053 RepID=UPI0012185484|nr:hypothetical protein [Phenylobacterium sp.]THD60664.1 MAG: hypothetical protein E8A12_10630 [Phenylobacterium sp.]
MTMAESTALRRRTVLGMALAVAIPAMGAACTARASAAELVDLTVVDRETGQPLQVWRHEGRLFVAGQPGARYSLRVANHTAGRVLLVMSVDGVNVVSGETANYGQTGYVLDAYQSYDVTGWRKSNTEVAAFSFAPLPQSYAARTGRPGDIGVIGLAVFKERVIPVDSVAPVAAPTADARNEVSETVVTGERATRAQSAPPPAAPRAAPALRSPAAAPPAAASSEMAAAAERRAEKLGTAHGAREWSVITNVDFERATSHPQLIRRIEYDTFDNLVASGMVRPNLGEARRPRPFPGNGDGAAYVPDPPGRP